MAELGIRASDGEAQVAAIALDQKAEFLETLGIAHVAI
jgi:hypothetical protein